MAEMPPGKLSLTVLILTHNEERHLERAIKSIAGLAEEVIIIDSFSTDQTESIARELRATVVKHTFTTQSDQLRWALSNVRVGTKWVLRLDTDEIVEPDLAIEIGKSLPYLDDDVVGVCLNRKQMFLGRWIRHGGRYPLWLLRIWRNGRGSVEERLMDEHILVRGGRTINLQGGFADVNLHDLGSFVRKHESYATREALDRLSAELALTPYFDVMAGTCGNAQAWYKRTVKEKIYNKLPFGIGPTSYFLWRYFFKLGFLDGREGLIYHFLQGFWYRFLVEAKLF